MSLTFTQLVTHRSPPPPPLTPHWWVLKSQLFVKDFNTTINVLTLKWFLVTGHVKFTIYPFNIPYTYIQFRHKKKLRRQELSIRRLKKKISLESNRQKLNQCYRIVRVKKIFMYDFMITDFNTMDLKRNFIRSPQSFPLVAIHISPVHNYRWPTSHFTP